MVTYGSTVLTPGLEPVISHEHRHIGLFTADEVPGLHLPDGYGRSIAAWFTRT
jgi:hypothetical protein